MTSDSGHASAASLRGAPIIVPAAPRRPLVDVAFLWGARMVSSFATVAVLAVAARRLPVDQFAQFALLVGLVAWIPILDFGFGSVLQNRASEQRAQGRDGAAAIVACIVGAGSFAVVATLVAVAGMAAWGRFAAPGLMQRPGLLAFTLCCLAVSGVSMLVHRVFAATNRLMLSAALSALQNILALCGLLATLQLASGPDALLVPLLGYFVPFTAVPLMALLALARRSGWFPALCDDGFRAAWRDPRLVKDSMKFWFVTLLSLTVVQFDQFIAFTCLPPRDFAHYTVACKLIAFLYFPFSALLVANWSRVAVAHSRQDRPAILGIVHSSVMIGAGYLLLAIAVLVPLAGKFSYLLPRGGGDIELTVLVGVGLVALNKVWTEAYALVYLATNHVATIAAYLPVQAVLSVGLQIVLVKAFGVYGLMLGGALSYFATSHWILPLRARQVFDQYAVQGR